MSSDLSLEQKRDPDQNTARSPVNWPVLVLTLAGALTLAWISFLLWMAFKVVGWVLH
jgi:hypothetical protein